MALEDRPSGLERWGQVDEEPLAWHVCVAWLNWDRGSRVTVVLKAGRGRGRSICLVGGTKWDIWKWNGMSSGMRYDVCEGVSALVSTYVRTEAGRDGAAGGTLSGDWFGWCVCVCVFISLAARRRRARESLVCRCYSLRWYFGRSSGGQEAVLYLV